MIINRSDYVQLSSPASWWLLTLHAQTTAFIARSATAFLSAYGSLSCGTFVFFRRRGRRAVWWVSSFSFKVEDVLIRRLLTNDSHNSRQRMRRYTDLNLSTPFNANQKEPHLALHVILTATVEVCLRPLAVDSTRYGGCSLSNRVALASVHSRGSLEGVSLGNCCSQYFRRWSTIGWKSNRFIHYTM